MKTIERTLLAGKQRSHWDNSLPWEAGWCQLGTCADAHYYGNWVNLRTYEFMSYIEGDFVHLQAQSRAEFVAELGKLVVGLRELGYAPVSLDTMCVFLNERVYAELGLTTLFPKEAV